jgi:hypothetical protein
MLKLLLGVVIELFVGISLAGVILALTIPLLHYSSPPGAHDSATRTIIIGVLGSAVAVALFRPGSAIRRYTKR